MLFLFSYSYIDIYLNHQSDFASIKDYNDLDLEELTDVDSKKDLPHPENDEKDSKKKLKEIDYYTFPQFMSCILKEFSSLAFFYLCTVSFYRMFKKF